MKLRTRKSRVIAAGALAAAVIGGGASIAVAAPSSPTTPSSEATTDAEDNDATIAGTLKAPADATKDHDDESAEEAALQEAATVTLAQAEQAALAAVPGTVTDSELDEENGFVVYEVEVKASDGGVTEVTVDAGDASVLAQQAEGDSDPVFTGTVVAPVTAEQAALQAVATMTPTEAEQAALGAVPGTVVESELDEEDGFVVYEIKVKASDGSVTEVTVDAGNASVLAQEIDD